MALAVVQIAPDNAGAGSVASTFSSNVTAGSTIVALGGPYASGGVPTETLTSVSDTLTNSFSLPSGGGPYNDGAHTKGYIEYATGSGAGADAVTLTMSGAPAGGGSVGIAVEVSGTGITAEQANGSSGTTSGVVTGPSITVAGPALLIAYQFSFAITNSASNNGWTGSVTALGNGIASKSVTAGTYTVDAFNMSASVADPWLILVIALKETGGGGGGIPIIGWYM